MIDALIAGKVFGQPRTMTSKAGKPFATAKVRAAAGESEALFVNVIAFDADTVATLLTLSDGDSVALAGSLSPKVWTDREGNSRPAVDLVAHKLLTAYHVTRKRNAVQSLVGQRQLPDFDDELSDI